MEETTQSGQNLIPIKNKKRMRRWVALSRFKRLMMARHLWLVRMGMLIAVVGIILGLVLMINVLLKMVGVDKYIEIARAFVFVKSEKVEVIDGRTNILVLGKAGEGQVAPDLTDTMILVSVGHKDASVKMISLPRDIWITSLRAKLNSAYYWGNQKQAGGGLVLAKSTVEEIVGVPVHYGMVIDFGGFVGLIDELGGVEVNVERGFTDEWFPVPGREADECDGDLEFRCRYETITFEPGRQLMSGEVALKYVRSRHSEDLTEGTDFARSARQRQVIVAIQEKMMSGGILRSPGRLKQMWEMGLSMIETDMTEIEMATIARRVYDARAKIESYSIPEEMLVNPPLLARYDNLYVLVPTGSVGEKTEDWTEVQKWVAETLK